MKKFVSLTLLCISSFQASAINPNPFYVVADDYIAPHLVEDHEKALVDFKHHVDKNGYKGSWRFYAFDDGRHVAFSKKQSHDYEAQDAKDWQEVADQFPKGFLQDNSSVYRQTITNQDFYLMRYMQELSYNDGINKPSKNMVWLEIELHRTPVKHHLKTWIEELKHKHSKLSFSVYGKQYGKNLPTIFVAFHTKSNAAFYQQLEKQGLNDPLRLLPDGLYQGVKSYNISLAKYVPEISY